MQNFSGKYSDLFSKIFCQIFKIFVKKQLILKDFSKTLKKFSHMEKMGWLGPYHKTGFHFRRLTVTFMILPLGTYMTQITQLVISITKFNTSKYTTMVEAERAENSHYFFFWKST